MESKMKIITVIFLCLLLTAAATAAANEFSINTPDGSFSLKITGSDSFEDGTTKTGTLIDNIAMKLEELDNNYLTKLSRMDKARAERLLSEIFALLALIPEDTSVNFQQTASHQAQGSSSINISMNINEHSMQEPQQLETSPPDPPKISEPAKTAMSETDFTVFLNNVKTESFSDDQLRVIRLGSGNAWFSVSQIIRMIDVLTYSDDKLEALQIMYLRVTDPQNAHNILNAFTFSSDKEDAERIIGRQENK